MRDVSRLGPKKGSGRSRSGGYEFEAPRRRRNCTAAAAESPLSSQIWLRRRGRFVFLRPWFRRLRRDGQLDERQFLQLRPAAAPEVRRQVIVSIRHLQNYLSRSCAR